MNTCKRHRFPPDIISYAVWLYYRFNLSHRDTFSIDEVFVKMNGKQHYLWRAVDQDGEVVNVFRRAIVGGIAGLIVVVTLSVLSPTLWVDVLGNETAENSQMRKRIFWRFEGGRVWIETFISQIA